MELEFTDRYDAVGMRRPSLRTVCRGDCEGMGVVPLYMQHGDSRPEDVAYEGVGLTEAQVRAWLAAEAREPTDDGWHFVTCPDCNGTGKTQGFWPRVRQEAWAVGRKWEFARSHVLVRPYSSGTAALALMQEKEQAALLVEQIEEQVEIAPEASLVIEAEGSRFPVAYGDRLDVAHPYWFNRKIALRVLFGRIK